MAGIKADSEACMSVDWLTVCSLLSEDICCWEHSLSAPVFIRATQNTQRLCNELWMSRGIKQVCLDSFSLYQHKEASLLLLLILLISFPPFPLLHSNHSQFLRSLFHSPLLSGFSYWYSEDERWWKWGYAGKLSPWPCVEGMKGIITVYFIPRFSCGISIKSPFQESK